MRELYPGDFPPQRWAVANLGLVDRVKPKQQADGADHTVILFVGRFEVRKGIDVVLDAISKIAPRYPDVRFVLAGEDRPLRPGEAMIGERWRAEHAGAPWLHQVHFAGVVEDEALHQLYAEADVALLPSRYESFGLVMAEAQMHGVPVVSSNVSGIPAVVRDGVDGILVPPGDVDDVVNALMRLLSDRELRTRLGANGRERFVEQFDIERFADRFEQLFATVELQPISSKTVTGPHWWLRRDGTPPALRAHSSCAFTVATSSATEVRSLLMQAESDAVVCIDGALHRLRPPDVHRHRLTDVHHGESIEVSVVEGAVVFGGVVTVRSEHR
ncbi:MAG TPA: glycosyltransferase family 4 protein [Ilumatobacteraceae bacterium]|nr:glycosyltransferase family 4 protein [Ilumatobacteraceae bacterium]